MPQVVLTEQTGRVLTVRFDDPPRNFLGSRMVDELGPMDATGNDDVTAAWERLRDGTLVDVTAP